jgi:hypothetical protein
MDMAKSAIIKQGKFSARVIFDSERLLKIFPATASGALGLNILNLKNWQRKFLLLQAIGQPF